MSTATALVDAAIDDLGMRGRPNEITRAYAAKHGRDFLDAPWCNMGVTEWAHRSGTAAAVLPVTDRAYTVWHARDFLQAGRWHPGTLATILAYARPGAVVFFAWEGTNTIDDIDHVGVVERVLPDGRLICIEGNTTGAPGGACRRRVRAHNVIAGFANPSYGTPDRNTWPGTLLRQGSRGALVKRVQKRLNVLTGAGLAVDGAYGPATARAVRRLQKSAGITVDGVVGADTWAAMWPAPEPAPEA